MNSRKEAKRLVKMIYRMYAPNGIHTKKNATILQFKCLARELEDAIQERANGQRDAIVLELVSLFQQHAGAK